MLLGELEVGRRGLRPAQQEDRTGLRELVDILDQGSIAEFNNRRKEEK